MSSTVKYRRSFGDWAFDMFENYFGPLCVLFVALLILGLFGTLAYACYDHFVAEKFSLRKDQWHCSATHTETVMVSQTVGSNVIFIPTPVTSCVQWSTN